MKKQHFLWIVALYVVALFYLAVTTPITPHEAKILYTSHTIVHYFMELGQHVIPGVLGLRIFFMLFGMLSILFFYEFSRRYFPKRQDAYLSTVIFMLLPGIITGSTLSNIAIIVLPLVLLFVLLYEKNHFLLLPFLMLALFFIDNASIIFFIALLVYGVIHNDKKLSILSAAFLIAFVYLAEGITIGGRPSGHFVEIFGLYAAVFSPLVFLYFFYTMYRILLREKKTLIWYISFTALAFSLLLSIRQKINISDFAPYVMIAIVLMVDTFNHSMRVRLPQFQKRYFMVFKVVIASLLLSSFVIFSHRLVYSMGKMPKNYFANKTYKPYFLAKSLKEQKRSCSDSIDHRMMYQLRYYGITKCSK